MPVELALDVCSSWPWDEEDMPLPDPVAAAIAISALA